MKLPEWHWGHFGGAAVLLLLLLLAAGVMHGVMAQDEAQSQPAVDTARQMLASQDYDAALSQLGEVLDEQPDNGEARFLKALALARSGQNDDALALFERLCKDFPNMADAWNNLGVLRAREGQLDGARAALAEAVQIDPEHVAAQQNLGDVYVALARQAYIDVSALAPDNAAAETKSHQLAALMRPKTASSGSRDAADAQTTADAALDVSADAQAQPQSPSLLANADDAGKSARAPAAQQASGDGHVAPDATASDAEKTPKAAVRAALQRWAQAWSAQDLDTYFAAYSDDFEPADDLSLQQWRALRVRRVGGPQHIRIQLSHVAVEITGADTAEVHFEQAYVSDRYQDDTHKTLTLQRGDHGWLIAKES